MDFEKLGTFFLGRELEADGSASDRLLLYDAKDLTTHGVIVGMTGSGKTGLGVALIEEAAIDGVPVLAIDPKGDLANLALTFPDLAATDFEPWVDPAAAARAGMDVPAFAADQAQRWRKGLADWGQDGQRISRLREAAEVRVYTPGSTAARPLSILRSLARPDDALLDDSELLAERLTGTVSGLLSLVGRNGEPTDRDHVLLARLLEHHWRNGRDVQLADLVLGVQTPPFAQVGVLEVNAFAPPAERNRLAMALNAVLASPSFGTWLQGDPMDVGSLLYDPAGKPRVSVVSIAHLSDAERQTVVALLLNEVIAWMRAQSGSSSLRALLYIDELFGFMPPVANPASKAPLLTLLKQARAYGLGVVLSTQNPVDLDYKGLSNAGTWFIGRLQTEQDRNRLLAGLLSADGAQGLDRSALNATLSGLGARTFFMHNVHDGAPTLFSTRWVMSYLAGPMTREQLRRLPQAPAGTTGTAAGPETAVASEALAAAGETRPALPSSVPERFLPVDGVAKGPVTYHPMVLGVADVHYHQASYGVNESRRVVRWLEPGLGALWADWTQSEEADVDVDRLRTAPEDGARFEAMARSVDAKTWTTTERDFARAIRTDLPLLLYRHRGLKLVSQAGEDEAAFHLRLRQASREKVDAEREKLRQATERKLATLAERLRKAEQTVERHAQSVQKRRLDAAVSVGTTLLGSFLGRKSPSASSMGTALRSVNRASGGNAEVERAKATAEAVSKEMQALEADLERELLKLAARPDETSEIETLPVRPKSTDVAVRSVVLAWRPFRQDEDGRWVDAGG